MSEILKTLEQIQKSRSALASLTVVDRNQLLLDIARMLVKESKNILRANQMDLKKLKRVEMSDRLELNEKRISGMIEALHKVAKLPDPLKQTLETKKLANGLQLNRISVPLGTVGVIYESRPNVTIDLAGLALKSGNALVLKGGSEAYETNRVLVKVIHKVLKKHQLPKDLVYLVASEQDWKKDLLESHNLIDVIIPRGGAGLIRWVRENSRVPVIETGAGVCHTLVDDGANINQAVKIIINAKTQRPSVCNALDTLVITKKSATKLLPIMAASLAEFRVEIFADNYSYKTLKYYYPEDLLRVAKPEHYGKEFISLKMSIKTVSNFEEGLKFVKEKTSGHSEAILSSNKKHIAQFLNEVDAAVVYANASTRFTDGEEFGMGAEVGVSTQKLHARGPMGLEALTSYKWIVKGNGQVR